jgi:hypothetical protein
MARPRSPRAMKSRLVEGERGWRGRFVSAVALRSVSAADGVALIILGSSGRVGRLVSGRRLGDRSCVAGSSGPEMAAYVSRREARC